MSKDEERNTLRGYIILNGNGRNNIAIGLMIIFTYFLIYAFLGSSEILLSMGGLPLINCTANLIENGFSGETIATLTKDFGQTIIVIFVVVFVQNLVPANTGRGFRRVIITIIGYIVLYLVSMWFVRNIVFSDKTGEILQMFIAIFSVVMGGLGAVFASPLRRIITKSMVQQVLRENLLNSRPVQWLASSFFITTVILFLAVMIEMTVGLAYFFTAIVTGFPAVLTMILMLVGMYFLILGGFGRE